MTKATRDIRSFETGALLVAAFLIGSTRAARAYIDPGTGSVLVQLVTGGAAGALVMVRLYWRRLRSKLGGKTAAADPTPSNDASWMPPDRRR